VKDAIAPAEVQPVTDTQPGYGLHRQDLGSLDTLAQSISTMGPTCSPAMTVPLVFASAGNGTWLAYLLAMVCALLMALCVARFARVGVPDFLYVFATSSLHPALGSILGPAAGVRGHRRFGSGRLCPLWQCGARRVLWRGARRAV
jgi:amino acid transporter